MAKPLEDFLLDLTLGIEEKVVWGDGTLPLRVRSYLSSELPPSEYMSAVRGLVFRQHEILLVRNPSEVHVVPGGRIEAGENPIDALRRELLEETGWAISGERLLGFMHFHPETSEPPRPDFLQLVYLAEATEHCPQEKLADDYEMGASFCSPEEARSMGISESQSMYLLEALDTRKVGG